MYKSLANIQQRKDMMYEKYKYVFETSQREDVIEDPSLMKPSERATLKEMETELDRLNTAQTRMETNVFVLRDLPGGPLSVR
jgi:DNA-directed RNA polymerase III subunit RPC3